MYVHTCMYVYINICIHMHMCDYVCARVCKHLESSIQLPKAPGFSPIGLTILNVSPREAP